MGKKGDALRAQKAQASRYTLTRAEIDAIRHQAVQDYIAKFRENLKKEFDAEKARIDEEVRAEWKRREEIFSDHGGPESMFTLMSMTLAVPIAVLLDEFGWRPLPDEKHKVHPRSRLGRFVLGCEERLNEIAEDEKQDIGRFCEEVWKRSGVRLHYNKGEDDDPDRHSDA